MPQVLGSPVFKSYKTPSSVRIGDKVFDGVSFSDTRRYFENGAKRSVNYLDTKDAEYSVYESGGKVDILWKRYRDPVKKVIDGHVYDNIVEETVKNGITRYENQDTLTLRTLIDVDDKGKILKINEPYELRLLKKINKVFGRFAKLLK